MNIASSAHQLSTLAVAQMPLAELGRQDIIELAVMGGMALVFVILAVLFVVKSRKKRIAELTAELERPGLSEERAEALPQAEPEPGPEAQPAIAAKPSKQDKELNKRDKEKEKQDLIDAVLRQDTASQDDTRKVEAAAQHDQAAKQADGAIRQEQLKQGLSKTRTGFIGRISSLFGAKRQLDSDLFEQLEQILLTTDVGVKTADHLLETVRKKLKGKDSADAQTVRDALKNEILSIFNLANPQLESSPHKPLVIMVVGVNGGGKTTTIGKLAHKYHSQGQQVVLGAGDTFRAAAADQLQVWADRAGTPMIRGAEGQDPSSVLFEAVKSGVDSNADVVIADTAGRLHTKTNLMEELKKVHRVLGKACPGAPHEVLLVLDATTGQNAIAQVEQFNAAIPLTGVVLTKLDGTAKGGVIIGISQQFKLPVRYIGIGEKLEDLRLFEAKNFVDALFAE